ncbi:MAG: class A beta-lactamase-related serine hydrolase [Candidatus Pacebacteria bacterium]|nr:class A beta-lactamase-related serine hydrolase [Candidatus Paceibacterota bacterium]MDR3583239.1 class A beta-lactamase-related serine hydrolase [Candidatus Paceibacterota bacterium]
MLKILKKIALPLGAFLLGAAIIWFALKNTAAPVLPAPNCSKNFPFLNNDINCQSFDDISNQIENLHVNIGGVIDDEKNNGHIIRASVFYRDLNTKRWFGINDTDDFYPASLLKLPVALIYYKVAELQPDIFDRQLQIPTAGEDPTNSDQHYPPQNPLVPGQTYSIGDMLKHMLVYSDNAPFGILSDTAKDYSVQVLTDLGMTVPPASSPPGDWKVTPRGFAAIFRTLYNASYLNTKYSNQVLDLLSQSTFTKGIASGVPKGVKVAHKFGEATGMNADGTVHSYVLNDCGIVYKPNNPFIVCVMTEGNDFSQQEKVIQEITKSAYNALQ